MELFARECETDELKNDEFFLNWHQAIREDLRRFLIILDKYQNSDAKEHLISFIDYIRNNISNYDTSDYERTDAGYDFICKKYERKLVNG